MALRLHNTRIIDASLQCFTFIIEQFSTVTDVLFSKPFFFDGHRWRLQGGVKGGHFGVFLRWLGGGEYSANTKCTIKFCLEIRNVQDASKSLYVGSMEEEDEFTKVGFGTGWSQLISEDEIQDPGAGFLDSDCIYVELRCHVVQTLFEEELVVNVSARTPSVTSSQFSLFGNEWSIVLFPRGEPKTGNIPQYDYTAVYLHREAASALRFKMTFILYIKDRKEVQITHHFCDNESTTAFGIEKFMRHRDLKAFAKGGLATVGVKITSVEPYFYFGLDTKQWKPPDVMGDPRQFEDYTIFPLSLQAGCSDEEKLMLKLMFDPGPDFKHAALDSSAYYVKILWAIRVFCPKEFEKRIDVNSWDVCGRSSFCYSQDEMTVTLPLQLSEVMNPYSPFLDDEKQLSVQVLITNANKVYDPLLAGGDKHSITKLREMNDQTKDSVEKFWRELLEDTSSEKDKVIADQESEIAAKEEELEQRKATINTLEDEVQDHEEYIIEMEDVVDSLDGKGKAEKPNSIRELIKSAQPDEEELKKQKEVAESLKAFLMKNLQFNISRVTVVGASGQGVTIKGNKEIDMAIFMKDLPRTEHRSWLPAIVYTVKTMLKQPTSESGSKDEKDNALLPCSDFVTTPTAVVFKCDDVSVVLFSTNDWEPHGGFPGLYQMTLEQPDEAQNFYNIAACELQTEFIAKQTDKCKDLIRVVKAWCNSVPWKNSESKPSQYLLCLLVTAAYQVIQGDASPAATGKTADKAVFLELAEMINDDKLEIFWNEYYASSQYPRELFPEPFELPVVQDPAIPTHNVASTGLGSWAQLRKEVVKWVGHLLP